MTKTSNTLPSARISNPCEQQPGVHSNTLGHFDGEDNKHLLRSEGSREVRVRFIRRPRTMWIDLHQLENVHGSPSTAQGRQPRHRITTASRSCQSTCQLWQIIRGSSQSAASRRQLMDPGFCRTDHCYMTWSLEEVKPISCNFCAQEFGDFKRVTHMSACSTCPFPSPTSRASRRAQLVRQPRRHRQHPSDGREPEPRVHQERRQLSRRGAARTKAAPTNRQPNQATLRGQRLDDRLWPSPRQTARSSRRAPTKSWSLSSSRRSRRCGPYHRQRGTLC